MQNTKTHFWSVTPPQNDSFHAHNFHPFCPITFGKSTKAAQLRCIIPVQVIWRLNRRSAGPTGEAVQQIHLVEVWESLILWLITELVWCVKSVNFVWHAESQASCLQTVLIYVSGEQHNHNRPLMLPKRVTHPTSTKLDQNHQIYTLIYKYKMSNSHFPPLRNKASTQYLPTQPLVL